MAGREKNEFLLSIINGTTNDELIAKANKTLGELKISIFSIDGELTAYEKEIHSKAEVLLSLVESINKATMNIENDIVSQAKDIFKIKANVDVKFNDEDEYIQKNVDVCKGLFVTVFDRIEKETDELKARALKNTRIEIADGTKDLLLAFDNFDKRIEALEEYVNNFIKDLKEKYSGKQMDLDVFSNKIETARNETILEANLKEINPYIITPDMNNKDLDDLKIIIKVCQTCEDKAVEMVQKTSNKDEKANLAVIYTECFNVRMNAYNAINMFILNKQKNFFDEIKEIDREIEEKKKDDKAKYNDFEILLAKKEYAVNNIRLVESEMLREK